jgi:hypothetical protein
VRPQRVVGAAITVGCLLLAGCSARDGAPGSPGAKNPQPAPVPTVLIVDASGSMNETDAPGPRIDAAKAAAGAFVDAMPDDSTMALMTYGTGTGSTDAEKDAGCQDVRTLVSLGHLNRDMMRSQISGLRASGYTPISLALQRAVSLLPADASPQAIVLVSDGEDTCGGPPCDAAAEAKRTHPGLTISTVGFKTEGEASAQLSCIASVTAGLFVQAGNANQLAARLTAVQNVSQAKGSLTSSGIDDIALGMTADDIRRLHGDFPGVGSTGSVTVVYVDCDMTFVDGVLNSIAPHDGGRTIDGVRPGSLIGKAVELYGKPVNTETNSDGSHSVIFSTDEKTDVGYRILVDRYAVGDNGTISGLVKTIILCRCAPHPGVGAGSANGSGSSGPGPEMVVLKPVDAQGNVQAGWTKDDSRRDTPLVCDVVGTTYPSRYDVTSGVLSCGGNADQADACWPTAGGSYLLCLQDPFGKSLSLIAATGVTAPMEPRSEDPVPMALILDDGTQCRVRIGGAWPFQVEQPDWVGYYSCTGTGFGAVWAPTSNGPDYSGIAKGPDGWTVWVGPEDGHLLQHKVKTAYFVGMA